MAAATAFAMLPSLRVFHEDADGYENIGMLMASVWRGEYPPFRLILATPVYLPGGRCYFVFGRFQPVLSYFNCIVGSLLAFFIYRLTVRFFHPAVGRLAALLIGLMPSMILWSSIALKDTFVTLMLIIALYSCVSLKERVSLSALAGIVFPHGGHPERPLLHGVFPRLRHRGLAGARRGLRVLTGIYKQIFLVAAALALFAILGFTETARTI